MLTIINPASRFNRNQIVLPFNSHMFTTTLFLFAVFGNQSSNRYLINPKSTEGLMKLLDTFLLTVTCRGNVVLVSSSVEQYLGHCRVSCQRYFLLFMEFLWKSNARLESFYLKLTSRTAPFHIIDIPRPRAFPTHPRSIQKHHDLLFTLRNPFGKLSANVVRRNLYFSRHDHVSKCKQSLIALHLLNSNCKTTRSEVLEAFSSFFLFSLECSRICTAKACST